MRYIVTAVSERSTNVLYLQRHISNLEIVWDKHRNAMETFIRGCLITGDDGAVRLEDDICLTRDFIGQVESAIGVHPQEVIQFFSRSKFDIEIGSRWRSAHTFNMCQCVYIPRGMSRSLVEYQQSQEWVGYHRTGQDTLIAKFLQKDGRRYWNHIPSLVEHAPVISVIDSRRSKFRQSRTFSDPELDGYSLGHCANI